VIDAGMDHALYRFSALPSRAPFRLPGGARVAICPVVHADDWVLDPPKGAHADPRFGDTYGVFHPDYRTHTWREYGLRIGIFRVFEALDRHGLRATLAINAAAAQKAPVIVEEALGRGWDLAGHGHVANEMVTSQMGEAAEAIHIRSALDTLEAISGERPTGWIGQDFSESRHTPRLLAREGIRWLADWPNDEQPYLMETTPPLLSIPVLSELDDVQSLWHRRIPTPRWPALVCEAYDVLAADGAQSARVMVIGLHAWLFGMPHRIRYLDATLAALAERPHAWHTRLTDLADWSLDFLDRRNVT